MLRTVFTKTLLDRWRGMTIAATLLAAWLLMAMAVYRDIDLSIYTDMPQGIRDLMGIPAGADAATLAYNMMLSFAAALTLAGMAVSMGSAAIAGEERNGTIGLLLGNPKSRTHVVVGKTASMVLLVAIATAVLWGAALLAPTLLDVEIGDTRVGAMVLHVGVNAVFYGFLAIAIGCWTGNRSLASGIPAGVMTISYFAVGLLPLVGGLEDLARVFPWYYFIAGDPLVNGAHWGHLGVLVAGTMVLGGIAFLGVNRRDLRGPSVGVSLLDRLRQNRRTRQVFERFAGSTRIARIWIKTTSEHQGLLFITAAVMFVVLGVLMGPMYNATESNLADLGDDFPETLMALAGNGDLSTPEGWFQVETFSLSAPVAVMIVTVVIGSRALAGEEAGRTMGLLLANPITRSTVVLEQALAMTVHALAVGVSIFAGVAIANLISGLAMSYAGIAATSALVTLLGLVFGSVALALSAAIGLVRVAVFGAIGAALTSHLLYSLLPLNDDYAGFAEWTPHYYFLGSDPLVNGMHWGHGAVLAGLVLLLVGAAVVLFDRRDLRQG